MIFAKKVVFLVILRTYYIPYCHSSVQERIYFFVAKKSLTLIFYDIQILHFPISIQEIVHLFKKKYSLRRGARCRINLTKLTFATRWKCEISLFWFFLQKQPGVQPL